MKKIGILGGGQLGMLLAQSIVRLGAEAIVYDPDPDAPACRAVHSSTNAPWDDEKALNNFLSSCDKVTYEFENIPYECLARLKQDTPITPNLDVLKITQNRTTEKAFLRKNDLPHVPYIEAESIAELESQIDNLNFPVILKSTTGGYDGKSQILIKDKNDLSGLLLQFKQKPSIHFPIVVEQVIDLYMEVSCITGRSKTGEEVIFPLFKNTHKNHILDTTVIPADLPDVALLSAIQDLSLKATERLGIVGLLCTEFFISRRQKGAKSSCTVGDFDLYINEFAPRPHNSGHITMNSCSLSQFDALSRILLDIPLPAPALSNTDYLCMANLLGDIWLAQGTEDGDKLDLSSISKCPQLTDLIIYGKKHARASRKMGHLVTRATTAEEAVKVANLLREQLKSKKSDNH